MKTYNVIWTEQLSVNIEAISEEEAVRKVYDCEYDENNLSSEISSSPEAYHLTPRTQQILEEQALKMEEMLREENVENSTLWLCKDGTCDNEVSYSYELLATQGEPVCEKCDGDMQYKGK